MEIQVLDSKEKLGEAAATCGAEAIRGAIARSGHAYIILATGASQLEMLKALVEKEIDWSRVTAFHLDEYIGLPMSHPASFRKYLKERFVEKSGNVAEFHYIDPDRDGPEEGCKRLSRLIGEVQIDAAFIGIGENAHLAFNDPPADFETEEPYIIVDLDEACRNQQFGEGWFDVPEDVPKRAISMSIRQILKSNRLIVTVPDERKAKAVKCALEDEVTPHCPASILRRHQECTLFLDRGSASLIEKKGA